jgi:hypothetical protein
MLIDCEVVNCQAKEKDAVPLKVGICPYCTKNKLSVNPQKDYSVAKMEGGY